MQDKLRVKIAGLAATLLCATALAACSSQQPRDARLENSATDKAPLPPLPIVEPPFNRTRLLLAVARAASSHAAGATNADTQRLLDGKQFEVRLRFGCDGQGPGIEAHGWSVDPDGRTLRLRVVPTLSLDDELVRSVAGANVEAAEGFWFSRPWLHYAICPLSQPATDPATNSDTQRRLGGNLQEAEPDAASATVQRIGIAQFFTADDSRTHRRMDRAFEAVKQLGEGEGVGQQGFNLVLSGRFRAHENGQVISCAGSGRDRPPDCIVSADVDRVWIERPEDKAVMAEWSV